MQITKEIFHYLEVNYKSYIFLLLKIFLSYLYMDDLTPAFVPIMISLLPCYNSMPIRGTPASPLSRLSEEMNLIRRWRRRVPHPNLPIAKQCNKNCTSNRNWGDSNDKVGKTRKELSSSSFKTLLTLKCTNYFFIVFLDIT